MVYETNSLSRSSKCAFTVRRRDLAGLPWYGMVLRYGVWLHKLLELIINCKKKRKKKNKERKEEKKEKKKKKKKEEKSHDKATMQ